MSVDSQMIRKSNDDGWLNAAVGEPYFLQQSFRLRGGKLQIAAEFEPTYPHLGGHPELVDFLKARYPEYRYIVVTNGAKQALEAAFFAYKNLHDHREVYHKPPHWPSFATLARNQGMGFTHQLHKSSAGTTVVLSSPNNPCGFEDRFGVCDIWDRAYADPVYGWSGFAPVHAVGVFSGAKLMGLSGLRIGWAGTNNAALADLMAMQVESSTSGVSNFVQAAALDYLKFQMEKGPSRTSEDFQRARDILESNGWGFFGTGFDRLTYTVYGAPMGVGMFAWFRANDPEKFALAVERAKIRLVTGEACGMKEPGWYRMSCGLERDKMRQVYQGLINAHASL